MFRSCLKRCKERSLEEAFKILKERIQLQSLERSQLLSLVKLLVAMQMDAMDVSVLCRKLDQVCVCLFVFGHGKFGMLILGLNFWMHANFCYTLSIGGSATDTFNYIGNCLSKKCWLAQQNGYLWSIIIKQPIKHLIHVCVKGQS